MRKPKFLKSKDPASALKGKALVCSTEAAAISIGIHVLLILLAGSIVAIRYVQKHEAALSGENIARPKLERRQLQMPVKVQNLQKKSSRPKVTSRMASVSKSSFSLPDMMGLDNIGGGFDRSGGERTLSSMGAAGSLGFGISGVNFFGAKSKGEKMVFIVDAGKNMVLDSKGGFYTYQFAKDRINRMIDNMRSATLFNVIVFTQKEIRMFRSNLVPANPANKKALKKWFEPVNKSTAVMGNIKDLSGDYRPAHTYEGSPLEGERGLESWFGPVQAAMEQKADNIFILTDGWGYHPIATADILRLNGLVSVKAWLESLGWNAERIAAHEKEEAQLRVKAQKILDQENAEREKAGKPRKFIKNWNNYIHSELKFPKTDGPPNFRSGLMDTTLRNRLLSILIWCIALTMCRRSWTNHAFIW